MLYRFCWIASLPTVILWALPGLTSEDTGLSRSDYPVVPSSEVGTLICYAQTDSGEILNLARLCNVGDVELDASRDPASSASGDRLDAIFGDRAARQGESCYFVDSKGRPCP